MNHELRLIRGLALGLGSALLVAGTALLPMPNAATASPFAQQDADTEWDQLKRDYRVLHSSISNQGVHPDDREYIGEFLDRLEAFGLEHPDMVGPMAAAAQLAVWLKDDDRVFTIFDQLVTNHSEDKRLSDAWISYFEEQGLTERVTEIHKRLAEIRPEDVATLNQYLMHIRQSDDVDGVIELLYQIAALDPDNADTNGQLAEYLVSRGMYDRAMEFLADKELSPETNARAITARAMVKFQRHEFEAALEDLNSIPDSAITDAALGSEISQNKTFLTQYVDSLWPMEQAFREQEASSDDLPRVELVLTDGTIVLELFENQAPNTVANFIKLAEDGFYDITTFHRVLPNFMVQGGCPNTKPEAEGLPGRGNPGYYIPDEVMNEGSRDHFTGTLSMANSGPANSGGSQFFICHRPTPWLNGKHTVFGRVLSGMELVHAMEQDDALIDVRVIRKRDHEYEPDTIPLPSTAIRDLGATSNNTGGGNVSGGALPRGGSGATPPETTEDDSTTESGDDGETTNDDDTEGGADADGDGDGGGDDGGGDDGNSGI